MSLATLARLGCVPVFGQPLPTKADDAGRGDRRFPAASEAGCSELHCFRVPVSAVAVGGARSVTQASRPAASALVIRRPVKMGSHRFGSLRLRGRAWASFRIVRGLVSP